MPLIQFSVNTDIAGVNRHTLLGSTGQGTFKLSHKLRKLPPPETEYVVKHVSLSASGHNTTNQRRSLPTIWMGVEFPQLDDEIIARRDNTIVVQDLNPDGGTEVMPPHLNTRGTLRFPITTYPVDGTDTSQLGVDSNRTDRFDILTVLGRDMVHAGTHVTNIPLGRMRMEEDFLNVVLTPYDEYGRIFTQTIGGDRIGRVRHLQIILEYK